MSNLADEELKSAIITALVKTEMILPGVDRKRIADAVLPVVAKKLSAVRIDAFKDALALIERCNSQHFSRINLSNAIWQLQQDAERAAGAEL